jgi:hypothetical protein
MQRWLEKAPAFQTVAQGGNRCVRPDEELLPRVGRLAAPPMPTAMDRKGRAVNRLCYHSSADEHARSSTRESGERWQAALMDRDSGVTGTVAEFQGQSWGQFLSFNSLLPVYLQSR